MNRNLRAAMLMMLAMAMISSNDAIIKTASESLGIGQILFIRGTLACLVMLVVIKATGRPLFPRAGLSRLNLARAAMETCATLCFVTGLSMLPMATASTLVWTSPLMLTFLAALVLGESVSRARWIAVTTGFAGTLLVTRPFGEEFTAAMLLPLGAAVFVALRDVVTRRLDSGLHSFYVTLATLVMVTLTGLAMSLFRWVPPAPGHLSLLAAASLLLTGGFFAQVTAIRTGELSFVSPFAFTGIAVALVLGFLIWHDQPTPGMLLGIALIAGSCIHIARSR